MSLQFVQLVEEKCAVQREILLDLVKLLLLSLDFPLYRTYIEKHHSDRQDWKQTLQTANSHDDQKSKIKMLSFLRLPVSLWAQPMLDFMMPNMITLILGRRRPGY